MSTMKRFRIKYRDDSPGSPTFTIIIRAYDRQDAQERFLESEDGDGWIIWSIEPID